MMKALTKFIENDSVTQKVLHAIGSLAQANSDNRARLVKGRTTTTTTTLYLSANYASTNRNWN